MIKPQLNIWSDLFIAKKKHLENRLISLIFARKVIITDGSEACYMALFLFDSTGTNSEGHPLVRATGQAAPKLD